MLAGISKKDARWNFQEDGRLEGEIDNTSILGSGSDIGKWWAAGDLLCYEWRSWRDYKKHCARLSVKGKRIQVFHQHDSGLKDETWTITDQGPRTATTVAGLRNGTIRQQIAGTQTASHAPPTPVTQNEVLFRAPQKASPKVQNQRDPIMDLHFGKYHALVIGNNRYRHLKNLKTARNDAIVVSETLSGDYGFKVKTLTDATRSDILGALAEMRATLKPDDNLLIYYAGHGIVDSVTEQGYWLPVDAENRNPSNWVSNSDLTNMLRAIRARHVMVVADSCYSGTLVRAVSANLPTARDKLAWIRRMLGKRGRTALVSGGLEPVVDGGTDSNHSVFAKAFITALKENKSVLEGQNLFELIKRPIILNADQTPEYSDIRLAGHEGGEFIFVRR